MHIILTRQTANLEAQRMMTTYNCIEKEEKDKWIVLFDYFRSDIIAGPSGLAVISLQKEDSLLVILIEWISKKVSVILEPLANLVLLSKTEKKPILQKENSFQSISRGISVIDLTKSLGC